MIVLVHGAPAFGAVERYVVAVARGLGDRGIDAALVFPDTPALAPFLELEGQVLLRPLPVALVEGSALAVVPAIRTALRELEADVAHITDVWPPALVGARLAGVRRLLVTHHTPELPRRDNLAGRFWRSVGWLARPEVIFTSESDRRTGGTQLLRSHVVPLGIDLERFRGTPRAPDATEPVIGNVARLVPQKGQRTLIEAAPVILESYPSSIFVIVGDGELADELHATARELGVSDRFTFTGERDDIPELLSTFDVFAFPSRFEGLCLAVIEAQAAGIPVVATPVGGIRETVVDGETGRLVPRDDANALAAAIVATLDDSETAREMAVRAQRRAFERFSEARMVEATVSLYTA